MRLRPWTDADLDALVALFAREEFWWYPFRRALDSDEAERFLGRQLRAQEGEEPAVWAAERRGTTELIGYIGLAVPHWLPPVMPAVEVGWRLHPGHWGQGLATEGGAASLRHGFEVLGLDRILAMCHPENVASAHVARKLGMRHVEDVPVPGFGQPTQVYAVSRAEWAEMADFGDAQ